MQINSLAVSYKPMLGNFYFMRKIIEQLKEQKEKAEQIFIKNCLIKRASLVNSAIPDTASYLDDVYELNEAISVLENHSMQKPGKAG